MSFFLAVDLGGTSTRFRLVNQLQQLHFEYVFASQGFNSFDELMATFLSLPEMPDVPIRATCIAIAGPVYGETATVTNLPWQINAIELATTFPLGKVRLCNDFEAIAHGISCLQEDEIVCLQKGNVQHVAQRAVLGAGTGLGQAILIPTQGGSWQVIPTEGGHVDFAPTDRMQILLLEHLRERFGHVSYERVVSGPGLVAIYEFLRALEQYDENTELRQAIISGDAAAAISQYAHEKQDKLASEAVLLFIKIYGAQAGNLALNVLPYAGLYIAGAIAAKNLTESYYEHFLTAFLAKGKMASLMSTIPVRLILNTEVGVLGAQHLALRSYV